ncbi:hypothetical protein [Paraburkholderia sp. J8-2]|uniref:hypothetical protein n=1 Tax=Paraburkholderia sp. J8-2 TaxID=2805440 RepID=UPI002AB7B1A2|nr:hypothetical protein [Paraburkholderia sp. J8-2]
MGRMTYDAWEVFHIRRNDQSEDAMSAAVAVALPGGHMQFFHVETFNLKSGIHVEQALMTALNTQYGTLQALPTRCTIIFVARWSPCRECIQGTIPKFLSLTNIVDKSIRVKFRFEKYYAHGIFPRAERVRSEHLWRTEGEAIAAYDALANQYDYHNFKVTDAVPGGFAVNLKRRLVFAPAQVTKTSQMDTWILT